MPDTIQIEQIKNRHLCLSERNEKNRLLCLTLVLFRDQETLSVTVFSVNFFWDEWLKSSHLIGCVLLACTLSIWHSILQVLLDAQQTGMRKFYDASIQIEFEEISHKLLLASVMNNAINSFNPIANNCPVCIKLCFDSTMALPRWKRLDNGMKICLTCPTLRKWCQSFCDVISISSAFESTHTHTHVRRTEYALRRLHFICVTLYSFNCFRLWNGEARKRKKEQKSRRSFDRFGLGACVLWACLVYGYMKYFAEIIVCAFLSGLSLLFFFGQRYKKKKAPNSFHLNAWVCWSVCSCINCWFCGTTSLISGEKEEATVHQTPNSPSLSLSVARTRSLSSPLFLFLFRY